MIQPVTRNIFLNSTLLNKQIWFKLDFKQGYKISTYLPLPIQYPASRIHSLIIK